MKVKEIKRKKLLFVYYKLNRPGGIARVLVSLANELVEYYDISLLVLLKDTTSFYELDKRVKVLSADSYQHWAFTKGCVGMDKYFSWLPKKNNIKYYMYDFGAYQTLNQWLEIHHHQYDTIITCMYKLSIGLSSNKKLASKTIGWEHSNHCSVGFVFNFIRRRYFKNLKGYVSINTHAYNYFKKYNNNSQLIHNIIGEPFESLGFNERRKNNLVFVGSLNSGKNVKELLDIFESANLEESWTLNIIGDGEEKEKLKNQVKYFTKKDRIIFHGKMDSIQISEYLSQSKIFVFTSLLETFGLVIVESMMSGNALILYNCNYGPSDIVNEKNGFLIPMHDKKMFQEKLEYLTQNPEVLENLMQSSFEESKNWKKDKMINQWKEIL